MILIYDATEVIIMKLAANIRFLRKSRRMNQAELAEELGYRSFTTIQKWEAGSSEPPVCTLLKLCEFFNVSIDEIVNADLARGERMIRNEEIIHIPVLGNVAAGIPIEAVEQILDYEDFPASKANGRDFFGLRIKGNSMAPRIIEGDVVIVRRQEYTDNGDIAIVMVENNDATCKKIKKTDNGLLMIPLNPEFEPIFYTNEEIRNLPVKIIGKVVELRGKF